MGRHLFKDPKAVVVLQKLIDDGTSDKQIQITLKEECGHFWGLSSIQRCRKRLCLKNDVEVVSVVGVDSDTPPTSLTGSQRANWYRIKFKKTGMFKTLQTQFTEEEVALYMEEYGRVCIQFDDIVTTEFMQIDDFLKHRILIARALKIIKNLNLMIESVTNWLSKHELDPEEEDKAVINAYREKTAQNLDHHAVIGKANDRYDKLVSEREKISKSLAATRKDRIEELKTGGQSFIALITEIQKDAKVRRQHSQYAELTKIASDDVLGAFHKKITFPDGSKDPIFLDGKTEDLENENK